MHEYAKLAHGGWIDPVGIDHFLCHYSSERFAPVVDELMQKAGLAIPRERWYSNLATRGNTGAASIFIMLDEFLRTHAVQPGERILCFIPESGRFTVAFVLIEVEAADAGQARTLPSPPLREADDVVPPPHDPADAPAALQHLLGELAAIWHHYRSRVMAAFEEAGIDGSYDVDDGVADGEDVEPGLCHRRFLDLLSL